jgi:hypothetical protein
MPSAPETRPDERPARSGLRPGERGSPGAVTRSDAEGRQDRVERRARRITCPVFVSLEVDVAQERRCEKAAAQERRRADLDETHRVAYMALIAGNTGYYELVATVANQLAHHGLQVPFQEAAAHLATVASGDTEGESARWLQEKIDHITAKLDAENER